MHMPPYSKEEVETLKKGVSTSSVPFSNAPAAATATRDERFDGARASPPLPPDEEAPQPPTEPHQPPTEEQMAELHEMLVTSIRGYGSQPQEPVRTVEEQIAALREPPNAFRPP